MEPFTGLKVPAAHASHVPPSGPEYPVLHVQFVIVLDPACDIDSNGHAMHVDTLCWPMWFEYLPPAHRVHATDPLPGLNVPAAHGWHAVPSGPEYPALQVQLVGMGLPDFE